MSRLASPLAIFAGLYMVHFCVPAFAIGYDTGYSFANVENQEYVIEALLFLVAVLVVFHFGAAWTSFGGRAEPQYVTHFTVWKSDSVLLVCAFLVLIGWITRLHVIEQDAYFQFSRAIQGNLEGPFYAAIRLAELFPLHALYILAIHASDSEGLASRKWKFLIMGSMCLELIYWLPTGRKEETIQIFLIPIIIRYIRTRSLPSVPVISLFIAFISVLFPLAYYYRFVLQQIVVADSDIFQAIPTAYSVLEAGGGTDPDLSASEILLHRLDLLESVSASVRLILSGDWKLELGQSYALALLAAFPRFIWASKPDFHYGTEFGHAAGLLDIDDWITSISVTFPGEAFLNFGWLGFLPFLFLGAGYGQLYKLTHVSKRLQTCTLLYAITLPTILYMGGTFSLYVGGLLKLIPMYAILGWIMSESIPASFNTTGR